MGFLDNFGKSKNKGIPQNATFRLTQEGREKLQMSLGDPKSQVMAALEARGSSADLDEITGASGLSRGQVEHLLKVLLRNGYVQYATSHMSGEEME